MRNRIDAFIAKAETTTNESAIAHVCMQEVAHLYATYSG